MQLDMSEVRQLHLNPKAFKKMHNLRFLEVYGCRHDNKVHGFEVLKSDFSKLRYLCWDGYSANSLPPNFNPKNLVALYMRSSKVEQLWNGDQKQSLVNLKHIDLSYSKHLCKMPNLSLIPNLESLILEGCTNLHQSFSSIHNLNKLVLLNLRECKILNRLSMGTHWKSLVKLILSSCSNLESVPYVPCTVKELYLDGTSIKELPPLEDLSRLEILNLKDCSRLVSLPESIGGLQSLRRVILSNCSTLKTVPHIPCAVEELYLDGITIRELPSLKHLNRLERLNLESCSRLESLPESICELKSLRKVILSNCSNLKTVPYIPCTVEHLYLAGAAIKELPSLEHLFRLVTLNLKNCSRLESLPEDICELKSLQYLYLSGCSKLDRLPNSLENLKALMVLEVEGIAIREVPSSITCLESLSMLSFARCRNLKALSFLVYPFMSCWLRELDLTDCCIEVLPNDLGRISQLESLFLGRNNFESLPVSIKDLSNLYRLDLHNREKLKSLPELPDKLLTIEAQGCTSLEALSGLPSLCLSMWSQIERISFINCFKLKLDGLPDLTDALVNIQINVNVKRGYLRSLMYPPRACICYPGSKIPEWFSFKTTGCLIELPAGWLNDNFVGFTLCAVASFRDYQELGAFKVRFCLLVNEEIVSFGDLFEYNGHEVIESDHVFVGYDYGIMSIEWLTLSLNSEGYIVFCVEHRSENSIDLREVKKCGVRLLYAEDNYMGTDAKVDRDQRLKPINWSADGYFPLGRLVMDTLGIFDTWSGHSEMLRRGMKQACYPDVLY